MDSYLFLNASRYHKNSKKEGIRFCDVIWGGTMQTWNSIIFISSLEFLQYSSSISRFTYQNNISSIRAFYITYINYTKVFIVSTFSRFYLIYLYYTLYKNTKCLSQRIRAYKLDISEHSVSLTSYVSKTGVLLYGHPRVILATHGLVIQIVSWKAIKN